MPWASTTRWRFVPCLPRSVGFLPVSWPPGAGHRGGVQRGPVPVDAIGLGQLFEKHLVQPAPDARLVPVSQPAPARHPAPAPHLGRQVLPGDARLQHEQDPRQRRPVRHPGPSALGLRRLRREQRRAHISLACWLNAVHDALPVVGRKHSAGCRTKAGPRHFCPKLTSALFAISVHKVAILAPDVLALPSRSHNPAFLRSDVPVMVLGIRGFSSC